MFILNFLTLWKSISINEILLASFGLKQLRLGVTDGENKLHRCDAVLRLLLELNVQ